MRTAPPAVAPGGSPDEVEAEFYEALQRGDIEALMRVWADDDEIVCVHPGGPRLIGAPAIRATFEAIFANGGIPVRPEQVHRLQQIACALHHLVERIEVATPDVPGGGPRSAFVLVINFYVKTPLGWRLAAHHASPGSVDALPATGGDAPAMLH